MYLIDKTKELTTEIIGNILRSFQSKELPQYLIWEKYYEGKNHIEKPSDYNDVVDIHDNYCQYLVDSYTGYLTGIPVQYSGENIDEILDILKYNDYISADTEMLRNALKFSKSFELNFIDEDGKQRFKSLDTKSCVDVYDNTILNELQYVIRFWREELNASVLEEKYIVEVYGPNNIKRYYSNIGFNSFTLLEEIPHYFGQCPVTVMTLNTEGTNIFNQIMSIQDAYDLVLGGGVTDYAAFCDAYMVITGCQITVEQAKEIREHRVFNLPDKDCDAKYLTKDINDTQTQNLINTLDKNAHKFGKCPDFSDEAFGTASGIALKMKMLGMENNASGIANYLKKALQRRIELICGILNLTDDTFRDIDIVISRNLPIDTASIAQEINTYRGLVSDETLLSQVDFVSDVKDELKKIEKQRQENIDLYANNFKDDLTDDE